MNYQLYMRRCLDLAMAGEGFVAPNPMVGAAIVFNDLIVAEGYHHVFGGPHAEVNAFNNLPSEIDPSQTTLFVNLEPCSHTGKTPPCADLIIRKGIKKVVIGTRDPNPAVNGKGIERLRKAGIEVIEDILPEECAFLNRRFFTFHKSQRPYITLKWAQSADGFIAPMPAKIKERKSVPVSGNLSRLLVHKWRSSEYAILVGKNTVLNDNPKLNVRGFAGTNPVRIVIDPENDLPRDSHVFDNSVSTYIFNGAVDAIINKTTYVRTRFPENDSGPLLSAMVQHHIQSVLVEGGAFTLSRMINENVWDEARVFTSDKMLLDGTPAPLLKTISSSEMAVGKDTLRIYYNPS